MRKTAAAALKKLKSCSGESISEVLIALLIAALSLTMLAGMITASGNLIEKSRTKIGSYVSAENVIVDQNSAGSGTGEVTIVVNGSGRAVKFSDENSAAKVDVKYFTNTEIGGREVISYDEQ